MDEESEDNLIPLKFHVENDNLSHLNTLICIKCNLCGIARRNFFCKTCVNSGKFSSTLNFQNHNYRER